MRIVAGLCRGRKLTPIQGRDIRPTSDRVREALFNILGPQVHHARVLDLFAGTGALGLEALSRGAGHVVFVDNAKTSCNIIRTNIDLCRMGTKADLIQADLVSGPLPEPLASGRFDLIFMDPPYKKGMIGHIMERLLFTDLLAPGGFLVIEHAAAENLPQIPNILDIYRQKKYSKTVISILTRALD